MTEENRPSASQSPPDATSIHVQRAIGGERESVAWVVAHFQPLVEAQVRLRLGPHGSPQDVEDLVAELWLVVLRRLGELEPRGGRYAPVLARFLGTTALQLCNNHLRKRIRRGRTASAPKPRAGDGSSSPPVFDGLPGDTTGVVSQVALLEVRDRIRRCLEELTPAKRDVLVLRIMEQRTNQEIAEILGLEPNTVAVRYKRALEDLRALLPAGVFDGLWEATR
jgi:RNA polymerase sigma-70 factor (ECF subfamily)